MILSLKFPAMQAQSGRYRFECDKIAIKMALIAAFGVMITVLFSLCLRCDAFQTGWIDGFGDKGTIP
jgi:hypothetical protein